MSELTKALAEPVLSKEMGVYLNEERTGTVAEGGRTSLQTVAETGVARR